MAYSKFLLFLFFILLLSYESFSLSVLHTHKKTEAQKKVNSTDTLCTKQYCKETYDLQEPFDPFNPRCDDNISCWIQWYGFPDCTDDNLTCWQQAVGYPKDCKQDDYQCWLKSYGYVQCEDAKCIKQFLNFTCSENDLKCWKQKTWQAPCKWNDWDCWVQNNMLSWYCHGKKGFQCISSFYGNQCKQTDQKCWKKQFYIPESECQKDVKCFKEFYFLPTCKDTDFECWNKLMYGPDCKKGDMKCLKQFLWIPTCEKEKDQVKCIKDWLNYPDCGRDDLQCWKNYKGNDMMPWFILYHHNKDITTNSHHATPRVEHTRNFGRLMGHKRQMRAQSHKDKRENHVKKPLKAHA